MDDLFGNIQLETSAVILPEEMIDKNKRKREKTTEIPDEIATPLKKKKKTCSVETFQEKELTLNIIPRKMQFTYFLEFCTDVFMEIGDAQEIILSKLTYKNFAKCNLTESPDNINSLCQLLPILLPNWEGDKSNLKTNGAPLAMLISSSALRSLELAREAKQALGNDCIVAKLFAKHMKISKQQSFLSSRICHFATGTPERLLQLLPKHEQIASSLKLIVLDWQREDLKNRRLIDIPETRKSLALLLREYLIPLVLASRAKFFIF